MRMGKEARKITMKRFLASGVVIVGVVSLVLGIVFIVQANTTSAEIRDGLQDEDVTLGLPADGEDGYVDGNVVDTTPELKTAESILLEHLRDNYGTYGSTASGSAERTSYLDGLTLMNSMYIATMGYGVTTVITAIGVFMIIVGIALGTTGTLLLQRK
jgi:hypothetical protein